MEIYWFHTVDQVMKLIHKFKREDLNCLVGKEPSTLVDIENVIYDCNGNIIFMYDSNFMLFNTKKKNVQLLMTGSIEYKEYLLGNYLITQWTNG